MALTAVLTDDPSLLPPLREVVRGSAVIVGVGSWPSLLRLIRERPVTVAAVDATTLPAGRAPEEALADLSSRFPNLGLIVLSPPDGDPLRLFQLGRAGVPNLILMGVEDVAHAVPRALRRAAEQGATAQVTRVMSNHLPRRELEAIRVAMDGVHHRWSADQFAAAVGFSRPFLSERLKACNLPSAGHLLIWTRLLHAGFWLQEPGRTGESVSRQLEYSNGAAFRRALKLYTGATPTQVVKSGGLHFVLDCFLRVCGLRATGAHAA